MVEVDLIMGKIMKNLWLLPIVGATLILIESALNLLNTLDALTGIVLSIIIFISVVLSRKDVYGSGAILLICTFFLLLSPIGYSGFDIGLLLILVGSLFLASGGPFTIGSFFFYIAIGAIIIDFIVFIILF